jgi:RimJ/RimL family protein N-acetyltransferase
MQITLRPITLEYGKYIVKWRNNEHVKDHCMTKSEISLESNEVFFNTYIRTGKYKQFIVERTDECIGVAFYPIATVYLKNMDYGNKRCELCIFTSDDEEWRSESQKIALKMLVDKAFNEYGMHKVYSYVFRKFPEEIELLMKVGFMTEVTLKDEAINEMGEYEDIVRLCIFNSTI